MLRDLWARLSPAVRRALTFWRRSIQARVVASTVVLSAVVVSAVGWILLQQVRQGLLEHRVEVVLGEVDDEMGDARGPAGGRIGAARSTSGGSSATWSTRSSTAARAAATASCWPVRKGRTSRLREGGGEYTSGLDLVSIPEDLEAHFDGVGRSTAWTYTEIVSSVAGESLLGPGRGCRLPGAAALGRQDLHALLPLPAHRGAGDAGARHPCPAHRRRTAAGPGRGPDLAGHAPGRDADPDGPPGSPSGSAAGRLQERLQVDRRGRHRPAGLLLQPDGHQPPAPDPAARGAQLGPAPLRLRRLPRAAHPADHRADGLRPPARRPRRLRPDGRPRGRAPPGRAGPLREPPRRPARDQPLRRRGGRARARGHQPRRHRQPGRRPPPSRSPTSATSGLVVEHPDDPVRAEVDQPPRGADPAQPGHQRHRPRAGRRPHRGRRGPARVRRGGSRDHRARPRRRPRAGGGRDGVQPVLALGPGPHPHAAAAPVSGLADRARRTPTSTAAGCRHGDAAGRAPSSGSPSRAGPAPRCGTARCRSIPEDAVSSDAAVVPGPQAAVPVQEVER